MRLSEISNILSAELKAPADIEITGINTIQDATDSEICFLASDKHAKLLSDCSAAAVIVAKYLNDCPITQLKVANVNAALIEVMKLFAPELKTFSGIHPTATVEPTAKIDPSAAVGPGAYISHGVTIGAGTIIGTNCSIGENTTIGQQCRLDSNVVVYHNCQIGNDCVIQSNSTIGAVGYGYSFIDGQHQLVPHNGGVILEDGVEIGANSCVDRAKFGNTIIGAGTKIDNQVQIGHNAQVGKLCLLAGKVGISGSVKIGNGVVFAGNSGAVDHVSIGDGAIVAACATVTRDIPPGKKVMGFGASDLNHELKCLSVYKRLPEIAKEVKRISKKVEKLEATEDN